MAESPDSERRSRLLGMGEALRQAAAAADWNSLGRQARALGPQLQALAARGPWTAAERSALQRLRSQHDAAAAAAAGAAEAIGTRLQTMRVNQEGWVAYAVHNETPESSASQP